MKIFSTNTCPVPNDLESVIHHKDEVPAELGGMSEQQVQKIWKSIESLYKTGNYPLITFCLRRQGKIWGCSRLAEVLLYENEDKSL
ncbi:Beta-lactamase class C [Acinetobacter baumannii]|nr:Beta-lactamase class C [Acinetobacter baumannii]